MIDVHNFPYPGILVGLDPNIDWMGICSRIDFCIMMLNKDIGHTGNPQLEEEMKSIIGQLWNIRPNSSDEILGAEGYLKYPKLEGGNGRVVNYRKDIPPKHASDDKANG